MENLERTLLSELRNYLHIDVDSCSKKITIIEKFDIDDAVSDMIHILFYKFNYTVCFERVTFDQKAIIYLNSLSWLSNYYVKFSNCIYNDEFYPIDLKLVDKISTSMKVDKILIDVASTDVETIKENKVYFKNLKYDKCVAWISSARNVEIKSSDIKKILSNRKKMSIGCKSMKLDNWKNFFKYEYRSFCTIRNSLEFKEIEFGFEKLLLLIK